MRSPTGEKLSEVQDRPSKPRWKMVIRDWQALGEFHNSPLPVTFKRLAVLLYQRNEFYSEDSVNDPKIGLQPKGSYGWYFTTSALRSLGPSTWPARLETDEHSYFRKSQLLASMELIVDVFVQKYLTCLDWEQVNVCLTRLSGHWKGFHATVFYGSELLL